MDMLTQQSLYSRERADRYLDDLLEGWRSIPELEEEWSAWDEMSKEDFAEEWPACESRLGQLRRWSDAGLLDVEQRQRFGELEGYVSSYREILERMLNE